MQCLTESPLITHDKITENLSKLLLINDMSLMPVTAGLILEESSQAIIKQKQDNVPDLEIGENYTVKVTRYLNRLTKQAVTESYLNRSTYSNIAIGTANIIDIWHAIPKEDYEAVKEDFNKTSFSSPSEGDLSLVAKFIKDRNDYVGLLKWAFAQGVSNDNEGTGMEKLLSKVRKQHGLVDISVAQDNYIPFQLDNTATVSVAVIKALEESYFINVSASVILGALRKVKQQ